MLKKCKGPCGLEKPIEEFPTNRPGSIERRPECRKCKNIKCNEYYHRTKTIDYAARDILNWSRRSAKNKNLEFNLELSDIIIPKYCPIFDIELKVNKNNNAPDSISIERIDNSKGYIKTNIIITSWKANHIKGPASLEEMKLIYENYNAVGNLDILHDLNNDYGRGSLKCKKYYSAKSRAKLKQLDFNIEKEDIIIPKFCPILNIELIRGNNTTNPNSPSLDRIDNTKGYVKGNIRIISFRANQLKLHSSYEEYEKIYLFYKKLIENKSIIL